MSYKEIDFGSYEAPNAKVLGMIIEDDLLKLSSTGSTIDDGSYDEWGDEL